MATVATEPGPTVSRRRKAARQEDAWRRRAPLLPALVFAIIVTQLPFLLTLWYSPTAPSAVLR
jgi:sorbitol/mannitol transport system permease protein